MPSRDLTVVESGALPAGPAPPTLADYLAALWRARVLLVAAAIVAGAIMFAMSLSGPRVYESTVTFAVSQSKIGEGMLAIAGTASFRPMVESLSTAALVMHEVGLDKPPNAMRPSDFLDNVMSVNEVRGTNLMRVTVVHTDREMAATIANSVAKHAVEVARNVSAAEARHARDMINEQVEEARKHLNDADAKLRTFKQTAQPEAVKKDVEAQLAGRLGILDLVVTIASEKAKLASLEKELKDRKGGDTPNRTESAGKVYEDLDQEAATSRAYLASLEKQKNELVDVKKLGASKLAALDHLYQIEIDLARLEVEQELAQKVYMEISQRYEEASLQVVGRSAELSIIDKAVPADRPVPRHVVRNTVVAGIAGLCLAMAGVLLWYATKDIRRAPAPAR